LPFPPLKFGGHGNVCQHYFPLFSFLFFSFFPSGRKRKTIAPLCSTLFLFFSGVRLLELVFFAFNEVSLFPSPLHFFPSFSSPLRYKSFGGRRPHGFPLLRDAPLGGVSFSVLALFFLLPFSSPSVHKKQIWSRMRGPFISFPSFPFFSFEEFSFRRDDFRYCVLPFFHPFFFPSSVAIRYSTTDDPSIRFYSSVRNTFTSWGSILTPSFFPTPFFLSSQG